MLSESERERKVRGREEGRRLAHEAALARARERPHGVGFCVSRPVILASSVGAVSASSLFPGVRSHTRTVARRGPRENSRASSLVVFFLLSNYTLDTTLEIIDISNAVRASGSLLARETFVFISEKYDGATPPFARSTKPCGPAKSASALQCSVDSHYHVCRVEARQHTTTAALLGCSPLVEPFRVDAN